MSTNEPGGLPFHSFIVKGWGIVCGANEEDSDEREPPMSGEFEEPDDNGLSYEEHFIAAISEGLEEAERGELYSHESVKQEILKRLTTDEN